MKKRLMIILSTLIILLLCFQSMAFAAKSEKSKEIVYGDSIIKTVESLDNVVIIPSPDADKSTYSPQPALDYVKTLRSKKNDPQDISIMGTGTLWGYSSRLITPPGGSSGYITAKVDSDISYGSNWVTYNGLTETSWTGENPWNANEVRLEDRIHLESNVYYISAPPGWTTTGNEAYMTFSEPNVWRIVHDSANQQFNTTGTVQWTAQYASGSFKFLYGGTAYWYSIQASDRYDF